MGDFNKQICRLCLVISPTCECETIDEIKKEILQVLQINMDFDISNSAVACTRCLQRLQDCFNFKSRIIKTLTEDIKKTSQREKIGKNVCLEKLKGCWFCCMSLIKESTYNYTTDLKGVVLLEDMIRHCLPEVDLNTHVHESHTCRQCVSSLERHYEFMKCCQEAEQKIVHFCQVAGHCTADKVNLEDMLKFKDYDMLGTPLIITKEYSDTEIVDENAIQCPKSEDIASIECEEIQIKDELDNGVKTDDYGELRVHNSSGDSMSSKETTKTRTSASKRKKHFCHKCPYSSNYSNNLKKHILTHSDNEAHGCTLCSFMTNTILSLQDHMTSHRGLTKRYGCPECTYETDRKYDLDLHRLKHKDNSEVKIHRCPSCTYKSKFKVHLMRHQKMLHKDPQEIPKHKCEMCDYETKYKYSLVTHMQTHEDPQVAYKFQCEKCPYKAKWKGSLDSHIMTHLKHLYSCDQCTFSTKFSFSLELHKCLHQKKKDWEKKGEEYKCKLCTYQARTSRSVKVHMIKAHVNPYELPKLKCAHCPYETVYKEQLLMHIRQGHDIENEPKLKCDLCNYKTAGKKLMRQHLNIHREATIQCYQCDFRTKWKSSLQKHIKLHQVGSCSPLKQQAISLRSHKNRNMKKSDDKKRILKRSDDYVSKI